MTEKQISIAFEVRGMTCAACAHHVEDALRMVAGVKEAQVPGWESGEAIVTATEGIDPAELETCVPSKALIRATGHYHAAGHSPFRGVTTSAEALDWGQVVAHKNELVAEMRRMRGRLKE